MLLRSDSSSASTAIPQQTNLSAQFSAATVANPGFVLVQQSRRKQSHGRLRWLEKVESNAFLGHLTNTPINRRRSGASIRTEASEEAKQVRRVLAVSQDLHTI